MDRSAGTLASKVILNERKWVMLALWCLSVLTPFKYICNFQNFWLDCYAGGNVRCAFYSISDGPKCRRTSLKGCVKCSEEDKWPLVTKADICLFQQLLILGWRGFGMIQPHMEACAVQCPSRKEEGLVIACYGFAQMVRIGCAHQWAQCPAQWACRFAHREAAAHSGGGHTAQTTREAGSQMWQNRCGKTLWQKCHYPTVREAASPLKCDKKEPNWPERTETLSLREKISWLWQNVRRIHLKKSWHCSEVPFLILYSLPLSGQSLSNTWAFFPCEQKLKVPLLNM